MSTDGFPDQFGGPLHKKFTRKRLYDMMLTLDHSPLPEQEKKIDSTFKEWKGIKEQTDDVCLFSFRVN